MKGLKALGGLALLGLGLKLVVDWFTEDENEIPVRRIFVSHSWKKSTTEYHKVIGKLERDDIVFYNHSIPEEKAYNTTNIKKLESIFRKKMVYCSKVFVLAQNGIKQDSFVGTEIKIANELNKTIIAIKPYGQYSIPAFIEKSAHDVISNDIRSITRVLKAN